MSALLQGALAPAKAAQRGLRDAAASAASAAREQHAPLPHPREIEASMRADEAADAGNAARAAKQPLVFMLTVTDAAVVVPLQSTCVLLIAIPHSDSLLVGYKKPAL